MGGRTTTAARFRSTSDSIGDTPSRLRLPSARRSASRTRQASDATAFNLRLSMRTTSTASVDRRPSTSPRGFHSTSYMTFRKLLRKPISRTPCLETGSWASSAASRTCIRSGWSPVKTSTGMAEGLTCPLTPAFGNSKHADRSGFLAGFLTAADFRRRHARGATRGRLRLSSGGDLGRNTFRGPGLKPWTSASEEASASPGFMVRKRARFQFRAEFYNLFNRVNLDPRSVITNRTDRIL